MNRTFGKKLCLQRLLDKTGRLIKTSVMLRGWDVAGPETE